MQQGDEQARLARQLLAGSFHGVLSTHSLEHEGYPFGSVVPYVLDPEGCPLMLLSHLSQHTANLDADGRCGLTVMESGSGDVQTRSRLSALGDVARTDQPPGMQRYFEYFPQTRVYHEQLGFRFYSFRAKRFHWNGGFATARWFAAGRIIRANPLGPDVERKILTHMNQDHVDSLHHYLGQLGKRFPDSPVVMVGIDAEGIDLRVADKLHRLKLPREINTAEEARSVLIEMAGAAPPGDA